MRPAAPVGAEIDLFHVRPVGLALEVEGHHHQRVIAGVNLELNKWGRSDDDWAGILPTEHPDRFYGISRGAILYAGNWAWNRAAEGNGRGAHVGRL